eukprot:tig00001003_g6290.t1
MAFVFAPASAGRTFVGQNGIAMKSAVHSIAEEKPVAQKVRARNFLGAAAGSRAFFAGNAVSVVSSSSAEAPIAPLRMQAFVAPAKPETPDREVAVVTLDGQSAGTITAPGKVFNVPINSHVVHRVVRWLQAKQRAGTAVVKSRSEIVATGKKSIKQKGSGGARHGSKSANIFVGGNKSFGPRERDFSHDMNRQERRLALKVALSSKLGADSLVVIDEAKLAEPKSKLLVQKLKAQNIESALIVDKDLDRNFYLAARNLPNVKVVPVSTLNVYDILRNEKLVLTKEAVVALEERLLAPIRR